MMTILISSIVAIFFYFAAGILQGLQLCRRLNGYRKVIFISAFLAISVHSILLYHWIDIGSGQNLAFFNVLSQVAWLISLILILISLLKPVVNLGVIIFPLTGLTIIFALIFPGYHVINTSAHPKELIHILLSFLATSILCIAGAQALLLALQERLLRRHKPTDLMQALMQAIPPLETMESLLFQMIALGVVLLTMVLISAALFFHPLFGGDLLQHTLLAIAAWVVFVILLAGRVLFGWRGRTAIRGTFGGVLMLVVVYVLT